MNEENNTDIPIAHTDENGVFHPGWKKEFIEGPGDAPYADVRIEPPQRASWQQEQAFLQGGGIGVANHPNTFDALESLTIMSKARAQAKYDYWYRKETEKLEKESK